MTACSLSIKGQIAYLLLNRPHAANALNADFWNSLPATIRGLDARGDIRAMVLHAQGPTFCAGMDLAEFANGIPDPASPAGREAFYHLARSLQETFTCLEQTRFPVLGVVQGACIGAGLELVVACDLRFAAADAHFRIEEINTGIMADVGALQRLPKILPEPIVKEMAFLGKTLSADAASRYGFVTGIWPSKEEALQAAIEAAEKISQKAAVAMAGSKAALHWARDHSVADALEWSARTQSALWSTDDIKNAITARMKNVPASFEPLSAKKPLGEI